MVKLDNARAYIEKFRRHGQKMSEDDAVKIHVGGIESYYRIGAFERRLLEKFGVLGSGYLIDLGCGSGRLAQTLVDLKHLELLGIDVVPDLIAYCRKTLRPDWRFEVGTDFTIPERDSVADCVAAFSLFTHLLHEESFVYLKDVYRVLKPGGKLVCSFLEYEEPDHRDIFLTMAKSVKADRPLVVFNEKNCLSFWADELGFDIERFVSAAEKFVDFPQPTMLPNGEVLSGGYSFGQSICVMRRKT